MMVTYVQEYLYSIQLRGNKYREHFRVRGINKQGGSRSHVMLKSIFDLNCPMKSVFLSRASNEKITF